MYAVAVGNGWVSPSEFWRMAPGEVWWLFEAKRPKDTAGKAELLKMLKEAKAAEAEEAARG